MRILFLSRWFPYPADNGAKIRIFNLIKGLSGQHHVDLLSFYEGEKVIAHLPQMKKYAADVQVFPYKQFQPAGLKAILGYFSTYPRSVLDTYSEDFARTVKKSAAEQHYDLVIASEIDMAIYALPLRGITKLLEELEITKILVPFKQETRIPNKLRSGLTWWKLSGYLKRILRSFDGCTVVSAIERSAVQSVVPEKVPAVIPNGVDTFAIKPDASVVVEPGSMIYNGAITYHVNFQAVLHFLEHIFPLIREKSPDAHLYVTGKINQSLIEKLPARDGVIFTGYLDDVRPLLLKCCVNVVPLTIGGGTRLKILESLAAGIPVVSTSTGAEGLDLVHGRDILIADEPAVFADAVVGLMNNPELRRAFAAQGRKRVVAQYDWGIINHQFEVYINGLVQTQSSLEPAI